MKIFQSVLGILIFTSLFTACPTFSADHNEQEREVGIHSEQDDMLQQFFGPGSLPQGLCEYYSMFPNRPRDEQVDMVVGPAFCALGAFALYQSLKDLREYRPLVLLDYMPLSDSSKQVGTRIFDCACLAYGFSASALGVSLLPFLYKNIDTVRNMQRARAGKPVEDEVIKGYIRALLNVCRRNNLQEDLRIKFFENHRNMDMLYQLQDCAKQVLIEEYLCSRDIANFDGVECIGDPFETLGPPAHWDGIEGRIFPLRSKFGLLVRMLQDRYTQPPYAQPADVQNALNELLHYNKGHNVKPGKR